MKIVILTLGTRGDTQPYLALGLGLQRAGHTVTLAAARSYEAWIRGLGLGFAEVRFNPQEFMARPDVQATFQNWHRNLGRLAQFIGQMQPLYTTVFEDIWEACQSAEAVIVSTTAHGGLDSAEKLGLHYCLAIPAPVVPTTAFPTILLPPGPRLGGGYNRLTHVLVEAAIEPAMHGVRNRWRRSVGLRPLPLGYNQWARTRAAGVPWLLGYSPVVVARPADWPACIHVTGYWFLDAPADYRPPEALVRFLGAGAPPVYIGFGSMGNDRAEALTRAAIQALQQTGQRGVLASGWAGVGQAGLPETIFKIDALPHDWLFPRMAAAVHHGGAGTTGASLRAGLPTIVTPFMFDQFAWGQIVAELGAGPRPVPVKDLTAEKLAAAGALKHWGRPPTRTKHQSAH